MPYQTIDEYIALYPAPVQAILTRVRETIRGEAPAATEKISYGLPTFFDGENIIHFGAAKNHIGIYPGADGVAAFTDRLTAYHTSKGAIQFPLKDPIPYELIREIAAYRVRQAGSRNSQK